MKGVWSSEQPGWQVICRQKFKQIICRRGEEPSPVASDPVCASLSTISWGSTMCPALCQALGMQRNRLGPVGMTEKAKTNAEQQGRDPKSFLGMCVLPHVVSGSWW